MVIFHSYVKLPEGISHPRAVQLMLLQELFSLLQESLQKDDLIADASSFIGCVSWKNMEKYGNIWRNMEKYGNIWKNMEKNGKLWKHMEKYGNIYGCVIGRAPILG